MSLTRCPSRSALARASMLVLLSVGAEGAGGQQLSRTAELGPAVTAYTAAHESEILKEFTDFLAIPNVATDTLNIERNAAALIQMMQRRGITARLLQSPTGGPPAVFGELRTPRAKRTIVLYAHYDGQPVDSAAWATPPWQPTLRNAPLESGGQIVPLPSTANANAAGPDWRLYARSAGDDKAAIVAMLTGLDALRAAGRQPGVNLKFFFEGEEEQGSPHTRALITSHAAALKSDGWIFSDGPVHQTRRQQILFGVRGVMGATMTVYGAARALHSGHYGNWVPNPASQLVGLLASMRDNNGKILIPGFYDDVRPLTNDERRALQTVPDADSTLRNDLLIARSEANNARLAERILLPALNIRAIHAGPSTGVANAIPTDATASIDFRLVPDETPERIKSLVEAHAAREGFFVVHQKPDSATRRAHANVLLMEWEGGYPAQRTAASDPFALDVVRTASAVLGAPVIQVPSLGGSLPTYMFAEVLKSPLVVVPIANHDDNQHAPNENLRLKNLWDGIRLFAGLEAELGASR
ncbi:MAG: M20/M25/M40 family metallo-hydrolase [Gemmatimonadaceae bacterium]